MRTVPYKDGQVAQGSLLYDMLTTPPGKHVTVAVFKAHADIVERDFDKVWGAYPHLINYKVGNDLHNHNSRTTHEDGNEQERPEPR